MSTDWVNAGLPSTRPLLRSEVEGHTSERRDNINHSISNTLITRGLPSKACKKYTQSYKG